MAGLQLEKIPSSRRTGRPKSKAGCRTCKLRRVKCDETRPVCHRCISARRVCDGYGIWGGGSEFDLRRRSSGLQQSPVHRISPDEQGCFEWFILRAGTKLPGIFSSEFWATVVVQASSNEPAVLHAILALSSAHKGQLDERVGAHAHSSTILQQEQLTMQQYSKAVRHLQPHFIANDKASIRVALITCLVFVSMEFIRGHYTVGIAHFRNGLQLLSRIKLLSDETAGQSVDIWINKTFARLYVQVQLFGLGFYYAEFETELQISLFHTDEQARCHLDRLLNRIVRLTKCCRKENNLEHTDRQSRIQSQLALWLKNYNSLRDRVPAETNRDKFAHGILQVYHKLASIMAQVSISQDESIFDSHLQDFVSIIELSIKIRVLATSPNLWAAFPEHAVGKSSVIEMGWIPPLYYTALKCRVRRVRLQAIQLLEIYSHSEGIWSSTLAAQIARKVMQIEEKNICQTEVELFSVTSIPNQEDMPSLPSCKILRIQEVEVKLPNDPQGRIKLSCKQFSRNVSISEFDLPSQIWTDRFETG